MRRRILPAPGSSRPAPVGMGSAAGVVFLLLVFVSVLLGFASHAPGQGPAGRQADGPLHDRPPGGADRAARVDSIFADWDGRESPGAAVAVLSDGEIVLERGYGLAQLEYGVPVTPGTVFHAASVTKQFIAFGIALLAERGRLSLDDDVRDHLPELPDLGGTIRLHHLVHHTSGLRDQWQLMALGGWRLDDVITQEQVLAMVRRQRGLNFPPGTRHLYSNTGYTLLAEVIERIAAEPFPRWMEEHVFAPLGMDGTHLHVDHEHLVPGRAYSYRKAEDAGDGSESAWRKAVLSYATAGATSLFTTGGDLLRWLRNFETGEVGGPAVITRMRERGVLADGDTLDYAFGLVRGEHRGRTTWSHSGGDAGFRSHVLHVPEERLGVAVLSNAASFEPGEMARRVADVYLGAGSDSRGEDPAARPPEGKGPPQVPSDSTAPPVSLPERLLDAYSGRYDLQGIGILEVRRAGSRLVVSTGGPAVELSALSDSVFRAPGIGATLTFRRQGAEAELELVIRTRAGEARGPRLPETKLTSDEMAGYTGEYFSPELRVFYRVERRNGSLVASHPKHGAIELEPAGEDAFTTDRWFMPKLVVTRDDAGAITGFTVEGGRVLGLRFLRVPAEKLPRPDAPSDSREEPSGARKAGGNPAPGGE